MPRGGQCCPIESTFPSGSLNHATLSPRGRGPNANLGIPNERIPFEYHPAGFEPGDGLLDIFHFPAQDGVPGRRKIRAFGDADGGVARFHHQSEGIVADKLKSELALVEFPSLLGITGRDKTDHFTGCQHFRPPRGLLSAPDDSTCDGSRLGGEEGHE